MWGTVLKPVVGTNVGTEATKNRNPLICNGLRMSKWRDSPPGRKLNLRGRHCRAFRLFRLTRSPSFRLRRTAHCAVGRLAPPRPYRPRVRIPAIDIAKRRYPQGASPFCCRSGGIRIRSGLWHPVHICNIWCNSVSITDRFHDIQYN